MRLTTRSVTQQSETGLPVRPSVNVAYGALIGAAMVAIFWLDRVTGSTPVQHLYYIPIVMAAIRFGLWPGVAISGLAIVLYHVGGELRDLHYSEADIVKISLFIGIGVVAARLSADRKRFRYLAMTDDLTGLHNLRSFESHLLSMVADAGRTRKPLSMIVLDVDRLKQLNDVHGHLAGAEAVRTVGHTIRDLLPAGAIACRYGGDEFAIVLPGQNAQQAAECAQVLRSAVENVAPRLAGTEWPAGTLSISLGVAALTNVHPFLVRSAEKDGEYLFHCADQALYQAKAAGRNCVTVWHPAVSAAAGR